MADDGTDLFGSTLGKHAGGVLFGSVYCVVHANPAWWKPQAIPGMHWVDTDALSIALLSNRSVDSDGNSRRLGVRLRAS